MKNILYKTLLVTLFLHYGIVISQEFVHPGMMHKASDLQRMKEKVALQAEPWYSGWEKLIANSLSSADYNMRGPNEIIYRGNDGVHGQNYPNLYNDVHAAYQNALRWHVAGTIANAEKAIEILNAWTGTLKEISGSSDQFLAAGIYGYQMANAGELMRDYEGWAKDDFEAFKKMMKDVFYVDNTDFLKRHNGTCNTHYWVNWDLCNMASVMAIGILCDDRDLYNEAIDYFKEGIGNGRYDRMVPYVYDGNLAQWQESGRDQGHATLGVSLAGPFCEMAWNQGDDLYGYDDNRLWKGFEYIAKYNLGNAVPYTTYNNCDNVNQRTISPVGRNQERAGWELVYNHYVNVKGLYSPYMQIITSKVRPEGGGGDYGSASGGFDQLGFGTLTASLEEKPKQSQSISFPSGFTIAVGEEKLDPGATSTSGLKVMYSSDNPEVAEVVNNKIIGKLCGTATITAWQVGNDLFKEASPVNRLVTVTNTTTALEGISKLYNLNSGLAVDVSGGSLADGAKIIQWTNTSGDNQNWKLKRIEGNYYSIISELSGKALDVINNSDETGAEVEQRTYTGEDYQIWKITDNCDKTFTIINKGNGLALGVANGSTDKGAAMEVNTYTGDKHQKFSLLMLESNKNAQLISFNPLDTTEMSNSEVILEATSSSGLPVTYTSTDTSVAVIVNNKAIIVGGGSAGIIASCDGDSIYEDAIDVEQRLIVKRKTQIITADEFPTLTYKDEDYEIVASASSELPLSYYSYNTAIARMLGNKLRIVGGGDVTILVYQSGNNEFDPAYLYKDISIQKLDQTINFPAIPDMEVGDSDYSPRASASSYLKVSYESSDTTIARIVNNRIRPVAEGECTITAFQEGDARRYNAAENVNQTLKVTDPLDIASFSDKDIKVDVKKEMNQVVVSVPESIVGTGSVKIYNIRGNMLAQSNLSNSEVALSLNGKGDKVLIVKVINIENTYIRKVVSP